MSSWYPLQSTVSQRCFFQALADPWDQLRLLSEWNLAGSVISVDSLTHYEANLDDILLDIPGKIMIKVFHVLSQSAQCATR